MTDDRLEKLKSTARAVNSDYLRHEAEKKEAEVATTFWAEIQEQLDGDHLEAILVLINDLNEKIAAQPSETEKDEVIRSLRKEAAGLRDELAKKAQELLNR